MRKFSAHYILSADCLLKNGILVTEDDGQVTEVRDTGGVLSELDRMEFHNGILVPGISPEAIIPGQSSDPVINDYERRTMTTEEWFQYLRKTQKRLPEKTIRELFSNFLLPEFSGFRPGMNTGVYLISGADLAGLKLTENSKLKKLV